MGIGFEVVEHPQRPIWVPVEGTHTLYVGQIVSYNKVTPYLTGGADPMIAAAGVCSSTTLDYPFGVVVGTSDTADAESYAQLATALINVKQITGVNTLAAQAARTNRMVEGMYAKGDPQPMAQVVRIEPFTVLRGYFRNSATVGTTVITQLSPTAVASTAMTFATFGFTGVVDNSTTYCVSGVNAGLYRRGTDASATACTYTREWPVIPATTDVFKRVNVPPQGYGRMNIDTTYGLWINNVAALTAHYYCICVLAMELGTDSGNEYIDFFFSPVHWMAAAAARAIT